MPVTRCRRPALACAVGLVLLVSAVTAATAQDGSGWTSDYGSPDFARRASVGIDVGKPLVFGVTGGYHFTERIAAQLGFAALGDFTALSAEMRVHILPLALESPVPFVAFGFTQYYLADGADETSPITVQGAVGAEYMFAGSIGASARLGYIEALGASSDSSVDRYGISDDVSTAFFTLGARYLF
jgi:hypothetical protein